MLIEEFSKSLHTIAKENLNYRVNDNNIHEVQKQALRTLKDHKGNRSQCLLCGNALNLKEGMPFYHRDIEYLQCSHCHHIQTKVSTPKHYPYGNNQEADFDKIYPPLNLDDYISRRERIYEPKLNWILNALNRFDDSREWIHSHWLELGSGAGYFLSAIKNRGVDTVKGIERNRNLVNYANQMVGDRTIHVEEALETALSQHSAQIYVAFFVLEHIDEAHAFWKTMAKLPAGTVFVFSVPTFSFATLLEAAFPDYAARNLDNVLHTQLYTDQSINYALKSSGYHKIAQWTFGQDMQDLVRLLLVKLQNNYPANMMASLEEKLSSVLDPLQQVLDQNYFSDARHVIAVKQS